MVSRVSLSVLLLGLLAAPAPALADDAAAAKDAYVKASRFFSAEEYEAALPLFEKAYRLSDRRPVTILGLAQCERALKRYDDAIVHFREYLATGPADAPQIEETIALLDDLVGLQRTAEAKRRAEDEARARAEAKKKPAPAPAPKPKPAPAVPAGEMNVEEAPLELSAEEPLPAVEAPPPPPPAAASPALTAQAPAPAEPEESGGVLSSPWFWVVTGVVVAGGAAAGGVLLARGGSPDTYGGTSGVVLGP